MILDEVLTRGREEPSFMKHLILLNVCDECAVQISEHDEGWCCMKCVVKIQTLMALTLTAPAVAAECTGDHSHANSNWVGEN